MENSALIQKLTEVATCSICISTLCDPKALPCIHTFCSACLTKYESEMGKKPGDEMPCPLCRKLFTIPCNGSSGLPNNFFIENILQSLTIAADEQVNIDCDVCLANQEESDEEICCAEMYCTDCHENMCSQCSNEHRRQKLSRGHCIVPIENRTTEELLKHKTVSTCKQHDDRPQEIYCFNCKTIICVMCFVEIHKSHDCRDIKKAAEQFRPELGLTFEKFRRYEKEALDKKDQLKKDRTNMLKSVTDTEKQIRDRSELVKSLVDEHTLTLLQELDLVKQNKMKEYEEAEEQIERHLTIMSSYETYSDVLKSRGSPADICRAVDGLQNTAKEIDKGHDFTQNQKISFTAKRLNATRLPNLLQQGNIIGTIEDLPESLQRSHQLVYETNDKQKFGLQEIDWSGWRSFTTIIQHDWEQPNWELQKGKKKKKKKKNY